MLHQAAEAKSHLLQVAQIPPAINQFTQALGWQTATQLLKLAHKYMPETRQKKKQMLLVWPMLRRKQLAMETSKLRDHLSSKQVSIQSATWWRSPAQMVVIVHDVDPIELVVFLPSLC